MSEAKPTTITLEMPDLRAASNLTAAVAESRAWFPDAATAPALCDHEASEAVVALVQKLGEVAESQRHRKGAQLEAALLQLAGMALATARAVVGRG